MNESVNPQLEAVIFKMLDSLKIVKYGEIAVSLKIHDGRVVSVVHSITQTIREIKEEQKKENKT
jgi:hypothetical protein